MGQLEPAAEMCAKAARLQSKNADPHYLLGLIRDRQGRADEAAASFARYVALEQATGSRRRGLEDHRNLGIALVRLQRREEAIESFRAGLALRPDPQVLILLGDLLRQKGLSDEAADCFRSALAIDPKAPAAHTGLGVVHMERGEPEQAAASFRAALAGNPNDANTHFNLAVALRRAGRQDAATDSLRRAIAIEPGDMQALNSLGNAFKQAGQYDAALAHYQRILQRDPGHANALSMQALIRRQTCNWQGLDTLEAKLVDAVRAGRAVAPFPMLSVTDDPALQLLCARQYSRSRSAAAPRTGARTARHDRLRLGYLSAELRTHAIPCLVAQLFEDHDRSRFEVFAFSYGENDGSPMRRRLEKAFDEFVDVRQLSNDAVARQIREREIDIVVDLTGHTSGARLEILASRPAPVQLHYIGYPGTLGVDFIDYLIVDPFIVPPDQQRHYSEALIYLSQCYQANDRRRAAAERIPDRAAAGLPPDAFVFCCFNQTYKITPAFFDVWMRLLEAVPGSVLWLLADNHWAEGNLRREAAARGVAPDRLIFAPKLPLEDHLARHRLADLFLDTFPYNAHTTASDALWMGLPVVTCAGRSFASRVAGSLLHAVGLPELIAQDMADYEQLALTLAHEPARLAALRHHLDSVRTTAPLFDIERTRREIEQAYEWVWGIHARGEAPRLLAIGRRGG